MFDGLWARTGLDRFFHVSPCPAGLGCVCVCGGVVVVVVKGQFKEVVKGGLYFGKVLMCFSCTAHFLPQGATSTSTISLLGQKQPRTVCTARAWMWAVFIGAVPTDSLSSSYLDCSYSSQGQRPSYLSYNSKLTTQDKDREKKNL